MKMPLPQFCLLTALALSLSSFSGAQPDKKDAGYSPYAGLDFPSQVYWGDTHVHTTLSPDAYSMATVLTREDAYRFARGETVTSNTGQPVRLSRPLDFLVVTDHAEFTGAFNLLDAEDPAFLQSPVGKRWHAMYQEGRRIDVFLEFTQLLHGARSFVYPEPIRRSVWNKITQTADRYNAPGTFTALIGFEWSSMPKGNNLHRNVLFRDGAAKASQVLPFSALDSQDPQDLWDYLENYESTTDGRVLAIPHNSNQSNGLMFSDRKLSGEPFDQPYARSRARWEPLVEATQIKGDSEAHPHLSPEDEFADYENWDETNLSMERPPKEPWMLQHEYVRAALKNGLAFEKQLGINPFKFGLVGSSDSHTALAAVEENNFFGKFGADEPAADRLKPKPYVLPVKDYASSGYAAVWARENTREAIFDAMARRETYATTGPRMVVRFFGGWDFDENAHLRPDHDLIGYRRGVPMGGDLYRPEQDDKTPRFLVVASKDPQGANLDRVQIVKGWFKADGTTAEKVYNVAVSDGRKIKNNQVKPLPSTVDVESATYKNSVGAEQLATVWTDPDFDPNQRAFYYVRVLAIATPRWSTYDAAFYGTERPEDKPAQLQERAYTSPIWYTPAHP